MLSTLDSNILTKEKTFSGISVRKISVSRDQNWVELAKSIDDGGIGMIKPSAAKSAFTVK
jgi:hypothetical protein